DPNTNRTLDFALYQPLSLGNLVWDDLNDNGLLDVTEQGLDGVIVKLYHDANFDGNVEGVELQTPVASTLTTDGGRYLFRALGRGNYVVELASANFSGAGALVEYRSSSDAVAGVQGAYEPAPDPDDVTGPNNHAIDNDDNGQTAVATGGSAVQSKVVTLEAGKEPQNETLVNDAITPDANANLTVDFGLYLPFSLGNRVWLDANNNGQHDSSEQGIGGVLVELYLTDGVTRTGSTVTDAQGYYRFDGLAAGDYVVEVSPYNFITGTEYASGVLLHYQSSTPDAGSPNADDDSQDDGIGHTPTADTGIRSLPLSLGLGPIEPTQETDLATTPNAQGARDAFANMTLDFGFFTTACLGNRAWQDNNANGIQESSEPGLAGVTVTLTTLAGQVLATQVTVADGHYQFCTLDPGQYVVQFTPPTGFVGSPQNRQESETDSDTDANGNTPVITLLSGAADAQWDAGFYQRPSALDEATEPTLYKLYLPTASR
ncbi:MAG: carboxypeptidase regulatory-like domain-containing protein, partial [Chloroflexi bacterium]|nr:carboxypeptidase regulatory-like domain-containing protein [Chloroflexota bacterium]